MFNQFFKYLITTGHNNNNNNNNHPSVCCYHHHYPTIEQMDKDKQVYYNDREEKDEAQENYNQRRATRSKDHQVITEEEEEEEKEEEEEQEHRDQDVTEDEDEESDVDIIPIQERRERLYSRTYHGGRSRNRRRRSNGYIIPNTSYHHYRSSSYSRYAPQPCWVLPVRYTPPPTRVPIHPRLSSAPPLVSLAIPQQRLQHQLLYPHIPVQRSPSFWMTSSPPPMTRFPPY